MTRCNRGVVLGNVTRWCNRAAGHVGDHLTIWQSRDFPFPEPPPRYTAQGVVWTGMDALGDGREPGARPRGHSEPLGGSFAKPDICTDCDGECGVCG